MSGRPSTADHNVVRLATALADRYRIERELGTGGMATVYLAHDLRHDRDVAIKALHPDLGAALGTERFLSEIRTTARLQHPHILPLLDSGAADGLLYYVMPVVTGETLRARLARERQLSIPETLRIAREVASALDYAHRQGVIHRDIKPENILLHDGSALVADFGIALAVQQAGGARMTQTGLSLGTPQYMSPEQAMGERAIDARSDIYSLGAVTYEMLTGEPPFTGATVQSIVAKVLTEKPTAPHAVRDTVPPVVEHAVLTALAKLPADRFATAAEFSSALSSSLAVEDVEASQHLRNGVRVHPRRRDPVVLGLSALVLVLAATVARVVGRSTNDEDPFPVRSELTTAFSSDAQVPVGAPAISPDGHVVVFAGRAASGRGTILYLRRLDQLNPKPIAGTENASSPVFSPDGKWLAFISRRRKLARIPLDGGGAIPLADVADDGGVDWSASGDLVVGPGVMEGLKGLNRLKAAGGALEPLTRIDPTRKELSHEWPRVLQDGKTVLFTIWYGAIDRSEIAAVSLDDGKVVPLGVLGSKALGVVDGRLVYVRHDGVAMAVRFDQRHLRASGVPTQVQDSIRMMDGSGGAAYAFMTHQGAFVFAHGVANRRLVWVDRSGAIRPALDDVHEFNFVRVSPDGKRAAVSIGTTQSDIWILDLATGTLTPLTTTGSTRNPVWSPDSRRILYVSTRGGRAAFWWQPADGSGPPVKAGEARHNPWMIDLAPDGHTTVFNSIYDGTFNLESFALDSTHDERDISASPVATEALGRFAPDGHSVAYMSDESGRGEIYVRSFPDVGARLQVSAGGGTRPVWSRDGKQLYYWNEGQILSATLARDPALRVVSRQKLFEGPYEREFDVSTDGTRFLMIKSESSGLGLVVVPNWLTELRQLTAASKAR
jgi:serine/threonine protein kinase/Tol biopolymer transport system component